MLFTQLLLEDYIKWRPTLLRAFCVALADVEPSVREAAHSSLFDLLLPRSPLLAYNSFVGLLFQLNGCTHSPHNPTPLPVRSHLISRLLHSMPISPISPLLSSLSPRFRPITPSHDPFSI